MARYPAANRSPGLGLQTRGGTVGVGRIAGPPGIVGDDGVAAFRNDAGDSGGLVGFEPVVRVMARVMTRVRSRVRFRAG